MGVLVVAGFGGEVADDVSEVEEAHIDIDSLLHCFALSLGFFDSFGAFFVFCFFFFRVE